MEIAAALLAQMTDPVRIILVAGALWVVSKPPPGESFYRPLSAGLFGIAVFLGFVLYRTPMPVSVLGYTIAVGIVSNTLLALLIGNGYRYYEARQR